MAVVSRPRVFVVLLVLGVGTATSSTAAPEEGRRLDRDAFLERLVPILVAGIQRKDTPHAVFHGDVDWHSAVHGHWAILRLARTTGKHAEAAERADLSLEPANLALEAKHLREHPSFEMPYGRAWFLRLAIEFERWSTEKGGKDPERLRATAREVARSLRTHLARGSSSPATPEYANPCWALAQLHAWYAFAKDEEGAAWVSGIVRERFLGSERGPGWERDASAEEFFSLFGNWAYLVARTSDAETLGRFLAARPVSEAALAPVPVAGRAAHAYGMNWSRAWALGALAQLAPRTEDRTRFQKAFEAHVARAAADHESLVGDVWAYDHWVPQFAVYALTDE
jgi:hypothetical protein